MIKDQGIPNPQIGFWSSLGHWVLILGLFASVTFVNAAEKHWAFQPVKKPALPAVKDATWVRNPIDRFVLARMEASKSI